MNLAGAILAGAHWRGAKATTGTRWRDGFDWRAAGVILVNLFGRPVPAGPEAADEAAPTAPQPHGQPATGDDLDAGGEARPGA